jgi:hypothetical protein
MVVDTIGLEPQIQGMPTVLEPEAIEPKYIRRPTALSQQNVASGLEPRRQITEAVCLEPTFLRMPTEPKWVPSAYKAKCIRGPRLHSQRQALYSEPIQILIFWLRKLNLL